ncbi:MAG: phage tail sheath C-terminal domain-containing protein [Cyanobacteria bacterium P01_F01_bin.53]
MRLWPVQVSYPGVYIQEIPSGVRTITGVSTSIAAFVGMVQRGRLNVPINVLNFTDYERAFGSDTSMSEMADQVRLFFQNGGQNAYIMRIAEGAMQAAVTLSNEFNQPTIKFAAKDFGLIGESVRFTVDYDTPQPESTFNLTVFREIVVNAELQIVERESHLDLSMNPNLGRYVKTVLDRDSRLLTVLLPEDDPTAPDPLPALIPGYTVSSTLLSGADDTSRISEAIREANPAAPAGLASGQFEISANGGAFNLVSLPEAGLDATVIADRIDDALRPTGASVTVTLSESVGANAYFRVSSTLPGGSIRIRRALSNDIAGLLGLGVADGGLEVDGYAVQRPAPTGIFSRVSSTNFSSLDTLGQFLQTAEADVADITVTDSVTTPAPPAVSPAYAGTVMWNRQNVDPADLSESLRNGRDNLDAIATAINTSTDIRWSAQRQGYRLVIRPDFGSADTDIDAAVASPVNDAAIDNPATGIFGNRANVARYRLGGYGAIGDYADGSQAGEDGNVPGLTEYSNAFGVIDSEVDIFNLLVLPQASDQNGDTIDLASVWGPASIFCQARRAFLLIDPPEDWRTVQDAVGGVTDLRDGLVLDHAAVYWPRLRITDPATGALKTVNIAGAMAGVYARTDSNRGVWKAPAGLEASIRGIRGIEYNISDPENGLINPEAINAIRSFPTGIVSWGARTMDGPNSNASADYRYIPIRRLALFIEESLFRGLKFAVFEPNDEPLWAQIRLAAGAFMNNLFRQGAFQGQRARDAYFVKVDAETTTQNDINLGIVNVVIGFAPLRPAEFVIITLQQMAGQIQT